MTKDERIKRIITESIKELDTIMDVTIAQAAKDVVKKAIGRSVRTKDPLFWPAGLLMLGLTEAAVWADSKGDEQLRDSILLSLKKHTDMWNKKYDGKLEYVDDALAGACFVILSEITEDQDYKTYADRIAGFLDGAKRDSENAIIYNPGRGNTNIFADGIGQTAMFYGAYAGLCDDELKVKYLEEAFLQLNNFRKYGCDLWSGLNYHGYELLEERAVSAEDDAYKSEKKGLLGWGRAFGWLMLGLAETVKVFRRCNFIDEDSAAAVEGKEISDWFKSLCNLAISYQREDGGFSWQLQAVEGHIDMSATGMIAYALIAALSSGLYTGDAAGEEAVKAAVSKAERCMFEYSAKGIVTGALSSCDDFGVHYQTYGAYPWGQGAVLAAVTSII